VDRNTCNVSFSGLAEGGWNRVTAGRELLTHFIPDADYNDARFVPLTKRESVASFMRALESKDSLLYKGAIAIVPIRFSTYQW
jgi:hypothetical protein